MRTKVRKRNLLVVMFLFVILGAIAKSQPNIAKFVYCGAGNPYLPLWEHLPDGEPRVFEGCGRLRWRICRAGVMKDRFLRIK